MVPLFITRRCIITLSGGHKVQATLSIPQPRKPLFMEQLEEQFIKEFNRSQPHAVKKAEAEKMLVQARAEREANELKSVSLTPAILKKMWIEKWDGKLPVYGNVPQIMMTK